MENNLDELVLGRPDLIEMEDRLCRLLSPFLSFSGHALYFPIENFPEEIELLPRERRLLLPLLWRGEKLGVLLLNGVKAAEAKRVLPQLPAITQLCLENLAMLRASNYEARSGLLNEAALFAKMEHEVSSLRAMLEDPGKLEGQSIPLHRLCLGLVVLKLNGVKKRLDDYYERYFSRLALACAQGAPSDVLCARLGMHEGRYEIGMLFPATGRGICHKLAQGALARMHAVEPPANENAPAIILSAGHALYPQDMAGQELVLPMFEQARRLRNRARLAAMVAINARLGKVAPENLSMPFSRILMDGGIILEALPMGRFKTSLGRESNAAEGMRFQVFSRSGDGNRGALRGEIVLLEVGERQSLAEILYLEDAAAMPLPGDNLVKIGVSPIRQPEAEEKKIAASGEYTFFRSHGEFLRLFEEKRAQSQKFVLGIARLASDSRDAIAFEALLQKIEKSLSEKTGDELPAGRYGSNSLIFFHEGATADACVSFYENLGKIAKDNGYAFAAGLASWPYLDFGKAEIEDCVLKALEYGILLPEPHIGVFNTLALNISADRRFSLGDIFGAVAEYHQALLADPDNAMARNSLGVCMASLKRYAEAKRLFLDALKKADDKVLAAKICYNLGAVAQNLGETRGALQYWRKCAAFAPGHGYVWIRLGQLYEQLGRKGEARNSYEHILGMENADAILTGSAKRHLARLAVRQQKGSAARELLHDALLQNPNDASAMLMLAGIYLQDNEDPAMVELLARKSVGLTGKPEAWKMLAEALRRLGREDEAREAEWRARPH